jgi:hypothetical protein
MCHRSAVCVCVCVGGILGRLMFENLIEYGSAGQIGDFSKLMVRRPVCDPTTLTQSCLVLVLVLRCATASTKEGQLLRTIPVVVGRSRLARGFDRPVAGKALIGMTET